MDIGSPVRSNSRKTKSPTPPTVPDPRDFQQLPDNRATIAAPNNLQSTTFHPPPQAPPSIAAGQSIPKHLPPKQPSPPLSQRTHARGKEKAKAKWNLPSSNEMKATRGSNEFNPFDKAAEDFDIHDLGLTTKTGQDIDYNESDIEAILRQTSLGQTGVCSTFHFSTFPFFLSPYPPNVVQVTLR